MLDQAATCAMFRAKPARRWMAALTPAVSARWLSNLACNSRRVRQVAVCYLASNYLPVRQVAVC